MNSTTRTSHEFDGVSTKAKSITKVSVQYIMPLPIIREPSFKSELHVPLVPANKSRRLSPHQYAECSTPDTGRRSAGLLGEHLLHGPTAKRLSKEKLFNRRSSESLQSLRTSSDDAISLKSFKDGTRSPFITMSPVWLRKKFVERQESQRRQMVCIDRGGSDCEGWLWKKQEGSNQKAKKWVIRWFELNQKKLRFYKHEEDTEPLGIIHLPGLKISPAPEVKNKKFAFKAHHSGTTFFFAAESQDDMVKWMNKMGLASLEDLDLSRYSTTAGFHKLDLDDMYDESSDCRSESDADSLDSLGSRLSSRPDSQRSSFAGSREDLVDLYSKLYKANIGIDGSNINDKRSTAFFSSIGQTEEEQHAFCKLLTLRRTLQDKEQQLKVINDLLEMNPITSEDIASFQQNHLVLVAEINDISEGEIMCQQDGSDIILNLENPDSCISRPLSSSDSITSV